MAVIPPGQGYGANGYAPLQIGAGDSLVFVLDVLAAYPNGAGAHGPAAAAGRRGPAAGLGGRDADDEDPAGTAAGEAA